MRAQRLGFRATGIEINPRYCRIARRIAPGAEVIEADALSWDRYGDFEVVYAYRLCIADADQRAFERWILPRLSPRALLIWPFHPEPYSYGWRLIQEHLWRHD